METFKDNTHTDGHNTASIQFRSENLFQRIGMVFMELWTLSILVTGSLEARFNFYGALIGSHQPSSSSQDISSKNTKLRIFYGEKKQMGTKSPVLPLFLTEGFLSGELKADGYSSLLDFVLCAFWHSIHIILVWQMGPLKFIYLPNLLQKMLNLTRTCKTQLTIFEKYSNFHNYAPP